MPKNPRFTPTPSRSSKRRATNSRVPSPRTVEILAFPSVQLLDVAGPLQVFATANELAAARGDAPLYAVRVVSSAAPVVTASAGLGLAVAPLPRTATKLDTLLLAGGPGVHAASQDIVVLDWLRRRATQARRVASVCTGAFLLGAAGLLNGRRAATHWMHCAELGRRYPDIRVESDPIYVRDGAVWTSAGVTAAIDLALALVEEDAGRALSLAVARHLVMFLKRPGGQAQFSTVLSLQGAEDRFGDLHTWMGGRLSGDLSLPALARKAGMSERSFSRHYAKATGLTPARAVERLRVEAARRLLSDTRLPVKRIAERCGFGSEETLRRSFGRLLASTPQDYRARFSA
ncbi:MAG TPA: GlxA family transcriptional regulator [Xanthobacteraceae bacterium]|jgi:transcriptional regulator GlxA family with amidase domain|nr:GlxA family transcriptional regulator [Xanthobacteraceae bacterium]